MATENQLNEDKQEVSEPPPTRAAKKHNVFSQIHQCGNFVDLLNANGS